MSVAPSDLPLPTDRLRGSVRERRPRLIQGPLLGPQRRSTLVAATALLLQRTCEVEQPAFSFADGTGRRLVQLQVAAGSSGAVLLAAAEARLHEPATPDPGPLRMELRWGAPLPEAAVAARGPDLELGAAAEAAGLRLWARFDACLLDEGTALLWLERLETLLGALDTDPEAPCPSLRLTGPREEELLARACSGGPAHAIDRPVLHRFLAAARQAPDAPAALHRERSLSYRAIEEQSGRIARHLGALGVGPEVPVAVLLRPSPEVLVALLAIFRARAIYLPLDPTHPEALLGHMVSEARPRLVLTSSELLPLAQRAGLTALCLDGPLPDGPGPLPEPAAGDAALLLYTSGTTGRPKGVVTTQRNLAHYLLAAQARYRFTAEDRFCLLARTTFSISLFDLLSPLLVGGSVLLVDRDDVLVPERLVRSIGLCTVLHAGPSLLATLFRWLRETPGAPRTLPGLRHVSSGGDLVPPAVIAEAGRVFPGAERYVIYGCTEVSCMGTTHEVDPAREPERPLVGRPFPGVQLRVVDAAGTPQPFGVTGEICLGGAGVARGYWQRPGLDGEKYFTQGETRFYRTGDLGRLHPDGALEILGRSDFQVQVHGIRVELAGLENTIRRLGLAQQCAAVLRRSGPDDARLVAFLVDPREAGTAAVRRALAAELPDYALPHQVVALPALPLNVNGKLDRRALQEMDLPAEALALQPHQRPRGEAEERIAAIFARLLGRDEVPVDQELLDLGGHSLLAVVALEEIGRELGVRLQPQAIFQGGSVRALAAQVRGAAGAALQPIRLNESPGREPLFFLSGIHIYRELARACEGRWAAFGLFSPDELVAAGDAEGRSVEQLARAYLPLLRGLQARGPYRLVGYSFAGLVAFELARQLRAEGEEVAFLGLIDAVLPEWHRSVWFRVAQLLRAARLSRGQLATLVRERLRRRLGAAALRDLAFARYGGDPRLSPLEQRRDQVNRRAAEEYLDQLQPSEQRATLVVAGERLEKNPLLSRNCGWGPYLRQLRVHTVRGDHFRMLSDPQLAAETARLLLGDLEGGG